MLTNIIRESRGTLWLALPLVAGQLSQMLMTVADTVMIGRLGVVPLAASTFANTILYLPLMFAIGMCMAISIRVSQARGSEEPENARRVLRHGMYLALLMGTLTLVFSLLLLPVLPYFKQEIEVIEAAPFYFILVALSMTPAIAAMAVKNHADAMNCPWPPFWILLGGVLLNVLLNWILIYGNLGSPALGLEGAGIATLLARTASLLAIFVWCVRAPQLRDWVPQRWFLAIEWSTLRDLLRVGLPASMQLLAEISAFVMITLVIGTLGAAALAAHQVAISCAATIFMVPIGISMAMTVRVGEAWGSGATPRIRPILIGGWSIGIGFTLVSAAAFVIFNQTIASWFLNDSSVQSLAARLLLIAAAFQMSDTMQILSSGMLRGLADVSYPAWTAFLAYWLISLPLGWYLTFGHQLGVAGMWWGMTVGLTLAALILSRRAWRKSDPIACLPGLPARE